MSAEKEKSPFYFIANQLALDFVNTQAVVDGQETDLLPDFAALLRWCVEAKVFPAASVTGLAKKWGNTGQGKAALSMAITLRSLLRELAQRISSGKPTPVKTLEFITEVLNQGNRPVELVHAGGRYEKRYRSEIERPAQLLAPVAEAAVELLVNGDPVLVRKCESPDCILWFYDTTKNHARRWCSMSGCGNRAKASAHYKRKRQTPDK